MIRNGHTDNVLKYIAVSDTLRLRHVANGERQGERPLSDQASRGNYLTQSLSTGHPLPENLSNYAVYIETRARAYRDLQHDAIRVQSESNRDRRLSMAIGSGSGGGPSSNGQPNRSKTVVGRKLRVMTVEKGLLRETKIVQKQVDALLGCRVCVPSLGVATCIICTQLLISVYEVAADEDEKVLHGQFRGWINTHRTQLAGERLAHSLLGGERGGYQRPRSAKYRVRGPLVLTMDTEHYFEMSFIDAEQALAIYKYFCEQTERVVEYLAISRKLSNLINVPIPNLKHVSRDILFSSIG